MVNHDCSPNAFWEFNGKELLIRSYKPISAGEEIRFCYIPDPGDYTQRRLQLKSMWNFDCTCNLCNAGPTGINADENIGSIVMDLKRRESPKSTEEIELVVRAFKMLQDAGYGPGDYPVYWFCHAMWAIEKYLRNEDSALKMCLKMRYLVEPAHNIDPYFRQDVLYHLINSLEGRSVAGLSNQSVVKLQLALRQLTTGFGGANLANVSY